MFVSMQQIKAKLKGFDAHVCTTSYINMAENEKIVIFFPVTLTTHTSVLLLQYYRILLVSIHKIL